MLDCEKTKINVSTIPDITADISALPTDPKTYLQAFTATDTVDTQNTGYCGPYNITLNPGFSFAKIQENNIEVDLKDVANVGIHDLQLTVSLTQYPSVKSQIKTFKVTLECKVKSIVFTTQPSPKLNLALDFDPLPLEIQFNVQKLPNCPPSGNPSMIFNLVETFSLATEITPRQDGVTLNIVPNSNNIGTYSLKMRATQDQAQADADFELKIFKPCSTAGILSQPDSVVSDFFVVLPLATRSQSQAFSIKIQKPEIYSELNCPFKTELGSGASNLSIQDSEILFSYEEGSNLGQLIQNELRKLTVTLEDDPKITRSFQPQQVKVKFK